MQSGKKPSDYLQEMLDYLEDSKNLYENAKKECEKYDSVDRLIYWAHKFEFANGKNERNRLATAYQRERIERRRYKDICDTYEKIHDFVCSENNKSTLKRMKGMIQNQKKQEEYLEGERVYKAGNQK